MFLKSAILVWRFFGAGYSVRYIYIDEAGTSAKEPVTVVVAIIVKPDNHWTAVRKEISELIKTVPEQHRQGFLFHAKAVWGDKRLREGWPLKDRLKLIASFAIIPAKFGLTIALGKMRRDAGGQVALDSNNLNKHFSLAQWHHARAFKQCVLEADGYLRERCDEGEIGTLIAEDVPEMRRQLRMAFEMARVLYVPPQLLDINGGSMHQGISQIQDGIQFADKNQAPLLQIADACAFCFRRFFSEQSYGNQLVQAMGIDLKIQDWLGPMSSGLFSHEPILRTSPYPIRFSDDG